MTMIIFYFDWQHAEQTHDEIIRISGGMSGYHKSYQDLDSIIQFAKHDDYYSTFEDKLTHIIFSINKNHIFSDGNKRTSLALGAYFLEINGYDYCVNNFIKEMENIVVLLADGKISKELLLKIVNSLINEPEYEESLKLEIINAINI